MDNLLVFLALIFSIYQFVKGYRVNSGTYLLQLREVFLEDKKNELHLYLRNKPSYSPADWAVVDDYLGTFEIVSIMIKRGVLNKKNIKDLYGYRIANIVQNQMIFESKLVMEYKAWRNFYELLYKLDGRRWKDFYNFLSKIENDSKTNFGNFGSLNELLTNIDVNTKNKFEQELINLKRGQMGPRLTHSPRN